MSRDVRRVEGFNDPERESPHLCASDGACRHRWALKPWLPFAPLEALVLAKDCAPTSAKHKEETPGVAKAWGRGVQFGRLTIDAADELAHALLGLHPCEVWGEAYWRMPVVVEPKPDPGESLDAFAARVREWEKAVA